MWFQNIIFLFSPLFYFVMAIYEVICKENIGSCISSPLTFSEQLQSVYSIIYKIYQIMALYSGFWLAWMQEKSRDTGRVYILSSGTWLISASNLPHFVCSANLYPCLIYFVPTDHTCLDHVLTLTAGISGPCHVLYS